MLNGKEPNRISVLLADNHPIVLKATSDLIREQIDFEIVAQVGSGAKAFRLISSLRPAIAILDLSMPDMHGIAVVDQLAAENCLTRVIFLSAHEDIAYVRQCLQAGARGYVLKRSPCEHLVQAVRSVSDGGLYLDACIAESVMGTGRSYVRAQALARELTEREHDVVRMVALGFTNKEIAGRFGINEKSIESYKSRAIEKLGLHTRSKIVQYGVLRGWFNDLTAPN